jgi:uncharacterized protein YdiU (UPF0061 family)
MLFQPEQTYPKLSPLLASSCTPTPVAEPQWIAFNQALASSLGIPAKLHNTEQGLLLYAGNQLPEWAQPHALAYAGHQFANFVPQLGDGRALLLTEVLDNNQQRFDIQLKGAGRTPYSRGGDGRSAIGPVLREYIVSEAMHALNIPTTRALAAVATGEVVQRESAQPGAILTRVASSHLRVGTAQYVLGLKRYDLLKQFADYVIQRHYPSAAEAASPYLELLNQVIDKQAQLIAKWMSVGFIHGVMNTDNMTLSGETIDYGPCAFMEAYNPAQKFSYIDRRGRYAYQNQPPIAMWNLARYAETLLPLLTETDNDTEQAIQVATAAVEGFESIYHGYYEQAMATKIGHGHKASEPVTQQLLERLLHLMQQQQVDFTLAFRYLGDTDSSRFIELFSQDKTSAKNWYQDWLASHNDSKLTVVKQAMNQVNPAVIPRNHRVEEVIQAAQNTGDLRPFNRLLQALQQPFEERPEFAEFMQPAKPSEQVTTTFCGT